MSVLKTVRVSLVAVLAVLAVLGAQVVSGGPARGEPASGSAAVLARPDFRAPWPCNEVRDYFHHSGEVVNAIDFNIAGSSDFGTPALASAAGIVTSAAPNGGYGNQVVVDHGGGWSSRVAHLSAFSVRVGQVVTVGQELGKVGSTGNSTGPHLHYEQINEGTRVPIIIDGVGLLYDGVTRQHRSANCRTSARHADRDVSGDGFADLMVVDADGKLYYYPNNIGTTGAPVSGATWASSAASWSGVKKVSSGDVSGDGFADLMVVDSDGKLYYYPNNMGTTGAPVTNATWASSTASWSGVKAMSAADISGDGSADLMVVDSDGKLYYYPNNMGTTGAPVTNATWASSTASWSGVKAMSAADISGDGFADLMVVDSDGKLYYYPNNINANGGVPFKDAAWVSPEATWGNVKSIAAGDFSGDQFADLMVVDGDGKLYYYPNNMIGNGGKPFTSAAWSSSTASWSGNRLAG
jgi:murein DD-endopeptidase MepM/ murein hydrolase activator NlpD